MNRFFKRLPLLAKLMLIGVIPFIFLVLLTIQVYRFKTEKLNLFTTYQTYIAESANINGLIDALQEERKFSFDYVLTRGPRQQLVLQRPHTDAFILKLRKAEDPSLKSFESYTKLGQLQDIRRGLDTFGLPANQIMHFYSNTVFRLNTLNTIPPANTAYLQPIHQDLMAQKLLSEMVTYLGIIRSNIYNVLYTRKYGAETLAGTTGAYDIYKSYGKELAVKASTQTLDQYKTLATTTAFKPTSDYIDTLFSRFSFDSSFTAAEWWKVSDDGENQLRQLQSQIWNRVNARINELFKEESESRDRTLVLLILALAMAVTVIVYIVYVISRTLKELKQAAERLANGESDIPIEVYSNDMVGSLAQSISKIDRTNKALASAARDIGNGNFSVPLSPRSKKDQLANAIIQMQNELKQYSNRMEQLVAQRTSELARSNEDLQQFAHVASHDMKEPLRKIATFSNMLSEEQNEVLSEKGKVYLSKIENAAKRMAQMIEGVLSYSTLSSSGDIKEPIDLNKIISEVENDLELAIIQKDARINYDHLPKVMGMRLLIYQLFYNLVNNALKFSKTDRPPVINITSKVATKEDHPFLNEMHDEFVQITISDNGIGFSQAYAEQIFGVFSRLNPKDKYEGTGLGLALCRKIVARHGGIIWAEGTEGSGAHFHMLLPAGK